MEKSFLVLLLFSLKESVIRLCILRLENFFDFLGCKELIQKDATTFLNFK